MSVAVAHLLTRIGDLGDGRDGPLIDFLARLINTRVVAIAHGENSRETWETRERATRDRWETVSHGRNPARRRVMEDLCDSLGGFGKIFWNFNSYFNIKQLWDQVARLGELGKLRGDCEWRYCTKSGMGKNL